tara:strand:+ start:3117 stop:3689 length:573 start_codon:yes stop_codon:yes gene_type:complete
MLKVLKKIYPIPRDNNYSILNYDNEGLWSITHPLDADIISKTILKSNDKTSKIIDLTAGCGGNLLSFGKHFDNVTGIENNKDRFNILKNNITCYDYKINIINDDCCNYLSNDFDIYFIDPPWGGPEYKFNNNLKLYLSNYELKDIIENIPKNKFIVIKIPYNYNYDYIKKNYNIIEKHNFNNIVILYFKN